MQIKVNTHETAGDEEFVARVEAQIAEALDRFQQHLTRVEVYLADVNAQKGGAADKRCLIEARPTGLQPIAVTHQAPTVPLAMNGAMEKIRRALDSALAKRTDHKGATSIRDSEIA